MNFLELSSSSSKPEPPLLPLLPSLHFLPPFNSLSLLPKVQSLNSKEEFSTFEKNLQNSWKPFSKKQTETIQKNSNQKQEIFRKRNFLIAPQKPCEFELKLKTKLESPLYKCKYFTFKVFLEKIGNTDLPVNQQVDLEVLVFSQDGVLITKNVRGQEILRGNSLQTMSFFVAENSHVAYFRIQLTEVSSHFVGKTVDLKIRSRSSEFLQSMGWKIKSLLIQGLVFKAKKKVKEESI